MRYAESKIDEFAESEENYKQNSENQLPFYMRQNQPLIDEDVEAFNRKLDNLILNFRSETINEFMKTKKTVLQDQANAIDGEQKKCHAMLAVKQNEIEQLKESLATALKEKEELSIRTEYMSIITCKSKTLTSLRVIQYKGFRALFEYMKWKKYVKVVMVRKQKELKELRMKRAL